MIKPKKKKKDNPNTEHITSLEEIVNIISSRYMSEMPSMNIYFANRQSDNTFFIFQELKSFPVEILLFNPINNSIAFSSVWYSDGAIPYLNGGKVLDLKAIRSPKYVDTNDIPTSADAKKLHSIINAQGYYNKGWLYKELDKINKINAFHRVRIENVRRIYLYDYYFEIFSENLCLIAVNADMVNFPYNFINAPDDSGKGHFSIANISSKADILGSNFPETYKKNMSYNKYIYYWKDHINTGNDNDEFFDTIDEELKTGKKVIKYKDIGQSFRKIEIEDE